MSENVLGFLQFETDSAKYITLKELHVIGSFLF